MKIDAIDAFYLAMPKVTEEADGSQDALVMRVRAGGHTGWGECEASPLPSIAALVTPMSSRLPQRRSGGARRAAGRAGRIAWIAGRIHYECMDLLQAPHTFSGIEAALWDLRQGAERAGLAASRLSAILPGNSLDASQLFGDEPQETLARGAPRRRPATAP